MRYLIANLTLMAVIWTVLTVLVAVYFNPRWWVYLGLAPLFLFIAGFLEERVLSGFVNRLVDTIWKVRK